MLEAHGTTVLDTSSPEAQQKGGDEWNALMEGATRTRLSPPAQKGEGDENDGRRWLRGGLDTALCPCDRVADPTGAEKAKKGRSLGPPCGGGRQSEESPCCSGGCI